jgi:GTP-binding protein
LKIGEAKFLKSCTKPSQFPNFPYPEFAFLGRSNVGKSSLLNMVLSRKDLVKTGSKPGVTKTINFFTVNDNLSFADLPGYGYAKLPAQLRKSFLPMIRSYIEARENLRMVFLLVDIRRDPDDFERDILDLCMENRRPVAVVLTKTDKVGTNELPRRRKKIIGALGIPEESTILSSTLKGKGKKEILSVIGEFSK